MYQEPLLSLNPDFPVSPIRVDQPEDILDSQTTEDYRLPSLQRIVGLFLLSCQERFQLPQNAINFTVNSVNSIVNTTCEVAKRSVNALESGASKTDVIAIIDQVKDPFAEFASEHMQTKFYREEFGLIVSANAFFFSYKSE